MVNYIDVTKQREEIIRFIRDYFFKNGTETTKAVIGVSGGKDSTIAAALLVDALGAERVLGVLMPCGVQDDIEDSYRVCKTLGIKHMEINIGSTCEALYDELPDLNGQIVSNTPARIRMTTLYAVAAGVGGRVCNTGNRTEAYLGYSTKWGDGAGDLALFRNLCVRDVLALGEWYIQHGILPNDLVYKTPADGLSGKTDEENMGLTYEMVDAWILDDKMPEDNKDYVNMMTRHKRNIHKEQSLNLPAPQRRRFYDGECDYPFEF